MMRRDVRHPDAEIEAGNPWYIEDQFQTQFGSPAFRAAVENRWRVFEGAIDDWARRVGRAPARILDAGCGDGINLSFLAQLVQDRRWPAVLLGADYSSLRLERAETLRAAQMVRASLTALAFREGSFDVVLCNQVLEHVPDVRTALDELWRILAPGGLLLVGVPNEGSALGILRNHVLQRSIRRSTDHVNMFTASTLRAALRQSNFIVHDLWPEGFFAPHTVVHSWLHRYRPVRDTLHRIVRPFPSLAAGLLVAAGRPLS